MTLFQAERSASTSLESGSSRWCGTVIVTRLAAWPLASQVAKPGCSNPSPAPSRTSPDFRARATPPLGTYGFQARRPSGTKTIRSVPRPGPLAACTLPVRSRRAGGYVAVPHDRGRQSTHHSHT